MNIEWIKNKSNEKFYPISHENAILCGDDSAQTLADKLDKYIVKQYGVAERLFSNINNEQLYYHSFYKDWWK